MHVSASTRQVRPGNTEPVSPSAADLLMGLELELRTPQEAQTASSVLCQFLPNPEWVHTGVMALCLGAIEFGCLGLDPQTKDALFRAGTWYAEVQQRLRQPENLDKRVSLKLRRFDDRFEISLSSNAPDFRFPSVKPANPRQLGCLGLTIAEGCFSSIQYSAERGSVVATLRRTEEETDTDCRADELCQHLNFAELVSSLGDDEELARDILSEYVSEYPSYAAATASALESGDLVALAKAAHRLKGALATIYATRAAERARTLEDACRITNAKQAIEEAADALGRELSRLQPTLRSWLRQQASEAS